MNDKLKEKHPDLPGLKALWNIDEEKLNTILWGFTNMDYRSSEAIGQANGFLSYMDGLDTNDLSEAWDEYVESEEYGGTDDGNPFID